MKLQKFKIGDCVLIRIPIERMHEFTPDIIEKYNNKQELHIESIAVNGNVYEYYMCELDARVYIEEECLVLTSRAWSGEEPKPMIQDIMKQIDKALETNDTASFNKLSVKYGLMRADWL